MVGESFKQKCAEWQNILEKAGVYAPAFELAEIITHATGLSRTEQLTAQVGNMASQDEAVLTGVQINGIDEVIRRRISGEPLQYIIGKWEFYGLEFYVGEGVLIPRAETETLVETALLLCKGNTAPKIADYCSGTGCVAIALAHCLPKAELTAVELSQEACEYLLKNIELNNAVNVSLLKADVLIDFWEGDEALDMITSNPPYICTAELEGLRREVQYEPKMALDGAEDGLLFYKKIAKNNKSHLKKGGWLVLEVGDTQSKEVYEILAENGYENIDTKKDLAGFTRVVYAQRC